MKNITVSIIIQISENENNLYSYLDDLFNQTLDNIEVILLTSINSSRLSFDINNPNIRITNDLKKCDLNGKYAIFAKTNFQYYLVALESLFEYSELNDIDLLFFTSLKYDINSKEIYETLFDSYNQIKYKSNGEVVNPTEILNNIFSIPPNIYNLFFNTRLLKKILSNCSIKEPTDNILLFYNALINSKKIAFYPNNVYIKKDDFKSTIYKFNQTDPLQRFSKINSDNYMKDIYYNLNQDDLIGVIFMTNELIRLFQENNLYSLYRYYLLNFKINLIKEIYFNMSFSLKSGGYKFIKSDFKKIYSNKLIHDYTVTNLKKSNLKFFRFILESKTFEEFILLYEPEFSIDSLIKENNLELLLNFENKSLKLENQGVYAENEEIKQRYDELKSNILNLQLENQRICAENEEIKQRYDELKSKISKFNE